MLNVTIFTSFPQFFETTAKISLLGSAIKNGRWELNIVNIRDYGITKHKTIDDTTYGGGCGMIMRPDVLGRCLDSNIDTNIKNRKLLVTSPRGQLFCQKTAEEISRECQHLYIVCNRFEGIDQRVINYYNMEEISIGNYILLGGEAAALVIIESTVRLLDGVIGKKESTQDETFCGNFKNIVEHDHYTKPSIWKDISVPKILLSGNHEEIKKWRIENGKERANRRNEKPINE